MMKIDSEHLCGMAVVVIKVLYHRVFRIMDTVKIPRKSSTMFAESLASPNYKGLIYVIVNESRWQVLLVRSCNWYRLL